MVVDFSGKVHGSISTVSGSSDGREVDDSSKGGIGDGRSGISGGRANKVAPVVSWEVGSRSGSSDSAGESGDGGVGVIRRSNSAGEIGASCGKGEIIAGLIVGDNRNIEVSCTESGGGVDGT